MQQYRLSIGRSVIVACVHVFVCVLLWCGVLTWPVRFEGARVVVGIDGAWGVAVHLAVHGQVAVSGDGDPLGGGDGVVVDGLSVRVAGQLGEHATAGGPVPLLGSDVFRS